MYQKTNINEYRNIILRQVPKEAEITKIEFEGPIIAIYSKNPKILMENGEIVKGIAKTIKKRIIVRSDPSVRKDPKDAREYILSTVPQEAEVIDIFFDEVLGEVIIEAKKPGLVIGKGGSILKQITLNTNWRAIVVRSAPIKSRVISQRMQLLREKREYRESFLRKVGMRIHRATFCKTDWIRISLLGGFQEVGRSAILVQTNRSSVLLDCGIKLGVTAPHEQFPRLDVNEFDVETLDAIVLTHAHLDHCGFVPFLFKYGYSGPVYCTKATQDLTALLQLDYIEVLSREGSFIPYSLRDVKKMMLHMISLDYGEVTDIAPDIKLTLHNAGHILGSAMAHLHIGDGLYNILYTSDFKFGKTRLLESAPSSFPRLEALIMESTYGGREDIMPDRIQSEKYFLSIINDTLSRKGKVLIPVLAVGRSQEIMLILHDAMEKNIIPRVPVFIEGMVLEATAIHTAHPEDLSNDLRDRIFYKGENPFISDVFIRVDDKYARADIIEGEPCIIMATSGMLMGGPALEYFKALAEDEKNSLIFVSYQPEGTLGRRIQNGLREVSLTDERGSMHVVKVKMNIRNVEGFSGHSDRRQLLRFIQNLTPKPREIIIGHGEKSKSESLASAIDKMFRIKTRAPNVMDAIRLT
jgi:KH/beta-lactamase-domain protein